MTKKPPIGTLHSMAKKASADAIPSILIFGSVMIVNGDENSSFEHHFESVEPLPVPANDV